MKNLIDDYCAQAVITRTQKYKFEKKPMFMADDLEGLTYSNFKMIVSTALSGRFCLKLNCPIKIADAIAKRGINVLYVVPLNEKISIQKHGYAERQEFIESELKKIKENYNAFTKVLEPHLESNFKKLQNIFESNSVDIEIDWSNQDFAEKWSEDQDFLWILSLISSNAELMLRLISSEMDYYEEKNMRSIDYYFETDPQNVSASYGYLHPKVFGNNIEYNLKFVNFILDFLGYKVVNELGYFTCDDNGENEQFNQGICIEENIDCFEPVRKLSISW